MQPPVCYNSIHVDRIIKHGNIKITDFIQGKCHWFEIQPCNIIYYAEEKYNFSNARQVIVTSQMLLCQCKDLNQDATNSQRKIG